jgi:chorismate synthase
MVAEVRRGQEGRDTLGGIVEVLAYRCRRARSHVQWDRKLDGRLAAALMSIQSVKGVEIGDGFTQARREARSH